MTPRGKSNSKLQDPDGLTQMQSAFCEEYLVDLNGTQAAIRAGYAFNSAPSTASGLLDHPAIVARIKRGMAARSARVRNLADRVVEELSLIAFSDIRWFKILPNGELEIVGISRGDSEDGELEIGPPPSDDVARVVSKLRRKTRRFTDTDGSVTVDTEVELLLWDKLKALQLLAAHTGLINNARHGNPLGIEDNTLTIVEAEE